MTPEPVPFLKICQTTDLFAPVHLGNFQYFAGQHYEVRTLDGATDIDTLETWLEGGKLLGARANYHGDLLKSFAYMAKVEDLQAFVVLEEGQPVLQVDVRLEQSRSYLRYKMNGHYCLSVHPRPDAYLDQIKNSLQAIVVALLRIEPLQMLFVELDKRQLRFVPAIVSAGFELIGPGHNSALHAKLFALDTAQRGSSFQAMFTVHG